MYNVQRSSTCRPLSCTLFFFNDTATTEIYTLSLHDALPISERQHDLHVRRQGDERRWRLRSKRPDRKSTRLNSSHVEISYAVFCLKKKKKTTNDPYFDIPYLHTTHQVNTSRTITSLHYIFFV